MDLESILREFSRCKSQFVLDLPLRYSTSEDILVGHLEKSAIIFGASFQRKMNVIHEAEVRKLGVYVLACAYVCKDVGLPILV